MGNTCCAATESPIAAPVEVPPRVSEGTVEEQEDPPANPPANSGPVVITVVGARGVRNSDWVPGTGGKPDCYCQVKGGAEKIYTTRTIDNVLEPVWAEEFEVEIADGAALEFSIYDKDLVGSDFLGLATLKAEDYKDKGFNGELKLADAGVEEAYIRVKVKVAGQPLPPGPPAEFTITITKASPEESLGVRFDLRDHTTCQVLEMLSGAAFSKYNETAPPEKQVKIYDYITNVNGVSGGSAKKLEQMVGEFKKAREVECTVKRFLYTSVVYDRGEASEPLRLEFAKSPTSDFLVVTGVDGKHNANARDHEKLCPGDRVVSMGSVQCKPAELQKKLKDHSGKVQLVVMRPATGHSEGGVERIDHWRYS